MYLSLRVVRGGFEHDARAQPSDINCFELGAARRTAEVAPRYRQPFAVCECEARFSLVSCRCSICLNRPRSLAAPRRAIRRRWCGSRTTLRSCERACWDTARRVGRPGSRGSLPGALGHQDKPEGARRGALAAACVRDIDGEYRTFRKRTGRPGRLRRRCGGSRVRACLPPPAPPSGTAAARARGDALCTTRSAAKQCAVQNKSGHFRRTERGSFGTRSVAAERRRLRRGLFANRKISPAACSSRTHDTRRGMYKVAPPRSQRHVWYAREPLRTQYEHEGD